MQQQTMLTDADIIKEWIVKQDVYSLCRYFFDWTLTKGQEEIVGDIAFVRHKRISINCYTRYGKTRCVALGVGLFILLNKDKRIAIIAPQKDQTDILREYIVDCIIRCPMLRDIVELSKTRDIHSMKKEASKTRQTFRNGCEYRVFSAYGEADRLMGFGAHLNIKDEAAKIGREASAKIFRMTGDDPEGSVLVDITNPWDRDTVAGDHYFDQDWKQIHIDWRQGVVEGRTTVAHIEEAKKEVSEMEFEVLYNSNYPAESSDALIRWAWLECAITIEAPVVKKEEKTFRGKEFIEETIDSVVIEKRIMGVDVAEAGLDFTVVTKLYKMKDGSYIVSEIQDWHKADTMETVGWILKMNQDYNADEIHVDAIGCGKGVFDRLREVSKEKGFVARGIKVGMTAERETYRFTNKKGEYYWKLRKLFEDRLIKIPKHAKLVKELRTMRYGLTSSEKVRIIDPGKKDDKGKVIGELKSPDFADSLMLACAKGKGVTVIW